MNYFNKLFVKSKNKASFAILFFFLGYVGTKALDWMTEKISLDSLSQLRDILKTKITLPVSTLILGALLTLSVLSAAQKIKIKRSKLRILKAEYGANSQWVDITAELNRHVMNDELVILITNDLAGDPLPGVRKIAKIHYEENGKKQNINVNEGEILKLPTPAVILAE